MLMFEVESVQCSNSLLKKGRHLDHVHKIKIYFTYLGYYKSLFQGLLKL